MAILLLINGASGVGKTTTAAILRASIEGAAWIHPDGEWDTAAMSSEQILRMALERVSWSDPAGISMVDCQIRGSHARHAISAIPHLDVVNVLLTCSRDERERRLRNRSNDRHDLERIEAWSRALEADARSVGDPVLDTSSQSPESVALQIRQRLTRGCMAAVGLAT